jgi:hypothetical protein
MMSRGFLVGLALILAAGSVRATELTVSPSDSVHASKIHAVNLDRLNADLERAGLALPARIDVTLIPERDPRARQVPHWIVGLALEPSDIVIFPDRVLAYPYDSLESVLRHEVTHLALSARADGRTLPRWFQEGVATSVDRRWGVSGQLRLLLEMIGDPGTADLSRLFTSGTQEGSVQAYGLSAALVADVQRKAGAKAPGAIAASVAAGVPFAEAFSRETGLSPDDAARRAWASYRRWTTWVSIVTSQSAVWGLMLALALAAFVVRARKRARQRWLWDEEDIGKLPSE